jgi:hypothetical protein
MSAFLIILLVFLSIVVDFGTTAVGASDQFGPAGVAISLVLQLGQLASLVMLRAEEARERPLLRWSLLSIAVVITAINALFNYYALHGIPEGPSDPLYVLRTLTPEDQNWTWNIALLLLSFVITTEADAVISTLVHTQGHLALMSASIPIYLSPFQAALGLAEGLSGEEGEGARERFDFMALAVPVLALFLVGMRGLDAYSTFVQTLEVVPRGGAIQSLVAAYAALMAITYQARILLLARSRIRVGLLEWGRMAAVTGLNIYCSVTFFSRWTEAALLAVVLGVMTSTLAEVLEAEATYALVLHFIGRPQGGVLRLTEEQLADAVARIGPAARSAYAALGAAVGVPLRIAWHLLGRSLAGPSEVVVTVSKKPSPGGEASRGEGSSSAPMGMPPSAGGGAGRSERGGSSSSAPVGTERAPASGGASDPRAERGGSAMQSLFSMMNQRQG